MNVVEIVAAIRVIREAALTVEQVQKFMDADDISEELVEQELNQTDSVIDEALDDL